MFYSRTTNNKINKLHGRALRLVYDDYVSTFEELLEKDNSLLFIIIIYRHSVENYIKSLVDSLKRYLVICLKEKILITVCDFVIPQVKSVYKGSNSLRYFGPIM